MAPRSSRPPDPPDIRVFRTTAEIDEAIAKLRRRIEDVEKLKTDPPRHNDARVRSVEDAISDTIRERFGKDSPQFGRHAYFKIDNGQWILGGPFESLAQAEHRWQQQFERNIPGAIDRLRGLIDWLLEKRADLGEPHVAPRMAFEGRTLHPAIGSAANRLFLTGHYAQAVFEAGKALVNLVKTKSGQTDRDGAKLMEFVFSASDPVLAFNDQSDTSDTDEQRGMMHLYVGAVMGIRNPGGHRVGVEERPERALQYLELFSLLADRLDDTRRVK
jgi:uncharacterized protein (TIGR02391 family)